MFLSNASVNRPIAISCIIIALTLLGFNAYRTIGNELMPKLDLPFITITTIYPGATPSEIETDVAKPIEDQMVTIDGLKHITSSCMENVCQTFIEFNLDVNVDIAATDVREKLDLIRSDFPMDVEDPRILKFDLNAKPVIHLALTGDAPLDELYDYADNTLRDRLTVISGVADVQLIGGAEREVHVRLDRKKLAARGLTSMHVVQAIQEGIRTIPSGRVREKGTEYNVKFDAEYDRFADIGDLEVANQEGRRCYLKDIGRVIMATEELRQNSLINGRPCIAIKVIKKAEANAVKVVNRVRAAMTGLEKRLPESMALIWVTDDGTFIEASVNSAWINVGQGIFLTALILFFFLYNFRALLVVSITMPLTIIIGLFFIQFLDFTLNTSTLIAIGMSVGILVTNSIVVLEAIVKRLNETGDPKSAARLGAAEVFIAVMASAGTNMVVLFPLSVMESKVGLFFEPFALTLLIMTVISLLISFTLTPLLCSVLLKHETGENNHRLRWMEQSWNRMFDRLVQAYGKSLTFLKNNRWAGLLFLCGLLLICFQSLTLLPRLGSTMMTNPDRGEIYVKMEFPTRYSLEHTQKRVREAESLLSGLSHLRHKLTAIGKVEGHIGRSSEGVYLAQILLRFSDRIERETTIHELMEHVRNRLAGFTDCIVTISMPSYMGGESSDIEMEIAGEDLGTLDRLAQDAQELTTTLSGIQNPDTSVRTGKPELKVSPRRAVLSDLNLPATGIGMALRANLEGLEAGTFKRGDRNYDIVVKLAQEQGQEQISALLFPGKPGYAIPLTTIGQVRKTVTPVQIIRKDKQRISKLFANLNTGNPLGKAVDDINNIMRKKQILPPGYTHTFSGEYEAMTEGQGELFEAAIIAILLVILTLAAIMESFRQPVIILVTTPLALIGLTWALYLTGQCLEFFVLMSGVMLIGIVVNNGILIMDRFNVNVAEGMPRHDAMIQAAGDRLRPIIMTTLAAFLGMLPLALGQGIGAELRNACGTACAGSILISGLLTPFVVPVLYNLFTRSNGEKK